MRVPRQTLQADRRTSAITLEGLTQAYNLGSVDVDEMYDVTPRGRNFGKRYRKKPGARHYGQKGSFSNR